MKKIFSYGLVLFFLIAKNANLLAMNNHVFIDRMLVSNSTESSSANLLLPLESADVITDKDELIYYVANLGIINPTKNRYDADIICVDSNNNIIFKETVKPSFAGYEYQLAGDTIKDITYKLKINLKSGEKGMNQLISFKKGENYFIKLYFDKNLIGITNFQYIVY